MQVRNILLVFVGVIVLGGLFLVYGIDEAGRSGPKLKEVATAPEHARYRIDGEYYRLFDGVFEREPNQGVRDVQRLAIEGEPSYGDIDGDGDDDAFVVLTHVTNDGAQWTRAAFAIYERGEFKGTDTFRLGRQVAIDDHTIHNGRAYLDYRTHAEGEGLDIDPRIARSLVFAYAQDRDAIVHVSNASLGQEDPDFATLDMQPWTWVRTEYSDGDEVEPEVQSADPFLLELDADGNVRAMTDCNTISGSYDVEGDMLSFGPLAMTKMYCEGSQDRVFAQMLSDVVSYRFTDDLQLILELREGTGRMLFR